MRWLRRLTGIIWCSTCGRTTFFWCDACRSCAKWWKANAPGIEQSGVTPELRKAYEFYVKNYRH